MQPLQNILQQLGETFTAQLTAANDRAALAEMEFARLRNGLRALVSSEAQSEPSPSLHLVKDTVNVETMAEPNPIGDSARSRVAIPDEPFLDVLTSEWQSAHAFRKALIAGGMTVAFGTVYKRMEKLTAAFPDLIEAGASPARWRLRAPSPKKNGKKAKRSASTARASRKLPLGACMPPLAVTDVRDRIAAYKAPQRTFAPVLHHADCFEEMKNLPNGSVDLIVTDPPYSLTGLDIDAPIDLAALWKEYRRIIKPTGNIVMFGSQPFTTRLIWEGYDLFKHDLIWIKNRATQAFKARHRPLKQHEDILVFSPGAAIARTLRRSTFNPLGQLSAGLKKLGSRKQSSYLHTKHRSGLVYEGTTNNPRSTVFCRKDKDNFHPFQKPLDLLEYLIRSYSDEGELVLDTFMGGGSTCLAAMRSGRRSIGIEKSKEFFDIAAKRIASAKGKALIATAHPVVAATSPQRGIISANDNSSVLRPTKSSSEWSIYQGDCLEVMRRMPSRSVDLIFTSPPYNLGSTRWGVRGAGNSDLWAGRKLANGYASYDDARDPTDYIEWQKDVLRECWRLLSDIGAIYYNHKPRIQQGLLQTPLDLSPGLPVRQIVIWDRRGGINFTNSSYLPTHEWIVIFAKPDFRLSTVGRRMKDVWDILPERKNDHPAPFPVALAQRAVETTYSGVVLDPFMGSGSTGVAALNCGRKFIGIELDPGYCEKAKERLELTAIAKAA